MAAAEHNGSAPRSATRSLAEPLDQTTVPSLTPDGRSSTPLYEALAIGLGCDVVGRPAANLSARSAPRDRRA